MKKILRLFGLVLIIVLLAGCVASHLDEGKRQYEIAMQSEDPLPHYKAALEELDAAIARDETLLQAYAIKGLIYRNIEDFERAVEYLDIAKQGSYGGQLQWVPVIINLTYGDIFHHRAVDAMRSGDWEQAKSYQETALEFFNNVITTSFSSLDEVVEGDVLSVSMQELYIKSQERWAAGKFQMAAIAGRIESKERQSEILRESIIRLSGVVESYPDSAALRYYLAEGYYKQALTLRKTMPEESEQMRQKAMTQLRVCAELGLPVELRNPAAQLLRSVSKGTEPDTEMKILGSSSL